MKICGLFSNVFDTDFQYNSTVIREQTLYDFRNLDPEIFAHCFMSIDMFQVAGL